MDLGTDSVCRTLLVRAAAATSVQLHVTCPLELLGRSVLLGLSVLLGQSVLLGLQEPLDGDVQEPLKPLVLLLGAQDFALVLHHCALHGAENLVGGRSEPVV
ncbi:hypothetical protein EYF80_001444 [Liparis tanakae]|uniref:Uncharacterized protein n=1 Tax=Liparis tanakae TaxID=230148 RepID=A0A4Z2JF25_9TELE|nr:hypothetical protein EYF80_001444 [Liparis tanakae]